MIDALIKIAGSLFVGGIGLILILMATLIFVVIIRETITWLNERR